MNWKAKIKKDDSDMSLLSLAPKWFTEAVELGKSEKELRALVHQFCKEQEDNGEPDHDWVDIILNMYLQMCREEV